MTFKVREIIITIIMVDVKIRVDEREIKKE
jgi:hypothetical protein